MISSLSFAELQTELTCTVYDESILLVISRAPASSWAPADDETCGGVTSSVGMPTSIASANDIKASPKSKRAAVLLCLFQGAEGELRVILTKRAGSLSSHSGLTPLFFTRLVLQSGRCKCSLYKCHVIMSL